MHFTAEKTTLAAAIAAAREAAARKSTIAVLDHLLFRLDGDRLTVTGTDLDLQLATEVGVAGAADGSACLPAQRLHEVVRNLPDGADIEIAPGRDGSTLFHIRSGRSHYALQSLPVEDFPLMTPPEQAISFTASAAALERLFRLTAPFCSTNESQYYLQGIYLHRTPTRLAAAATDGLRLATAALPPPEGCEGAALDTGIILPRPTAHVVARQAEGDVTVRLSESKISFDWGLTTLTSKLIDATYPDYQRLVPSGGAVTIEAEAAAAKALTARVAAIAVPDGKDRVRMVVLSVANNWATFSAEGENGEVGTEEMEVQASGSITLAFNSRFLAEAVAIFGDDRVSLAFTSPTEPALLRAATDPDAAVVLMPMRLADAQVQGAAA